MFCAEEPEKEDPRPPRSDPDPDDLPEQSDPRELTVGQLFTLNSLEQSIQNMTKEECHQMTIDIVRQMMTKVGTPLLPPALPERTLPRKPLQLKWKLVDVA